MLALSAVGAPQQWGGRLPHNARWPCQEATRGETEGEAKVEARCEAEAAAKEEAHRSQEIFEVLARGLRQTAAGSTGAT